MCYFSNEHHLVMIQAKLPESKWRTGRYLLTLYWNRFFVRRWTPHPFLPARI